MTSPGKIVGYKSFRDGLGFRDEPIYEAEAATLWAQCEEADARRKEMLPDEASAIKALFDAYLRLKDFGWNDAVYCPKDGTMFKVLEIGSTGKHDCIYEGKWPTGSWWILSDGDMSPSRPVLFKPLTAEVQK